MQRLAGECKRTSSRRWSRRERRVVVFGICAMTCLVLARPALSGRDTFDGVYTGKRVLTKGSVGPECPANDDVSVTIHGETLSFTNSALRDFLIDFTPHRDGSFNQTYIDEGGAAVEIRGRVSGDVIQADVRNTSSGCEHHWHLKRSQ